MTNSKFTKIKNEFPIIQSNSVLKTMNCNVLISIGKTMQKSRITAGELCSPRITN